MEITSPLRNKRIRKNDLNNKDLDIDYKIYSVNSDSGNNQKSANKKSTEYYSTMIKGSRKISVPGTENISDSVASDSDLFKKGEKLSMKNLSKLRRHNNTSDEGNSDESDEIDVNETSITESEDKTTQSSKKTTSSSEEEDSDMTRALGRLDKKMKRDKKKSRKYSDDFSSSMSHNSMKDQGMFSNLPDSIRNKINNLPNGFVDEVPDFITQMMNKEQHNNSAQQANPMAQFLGSSQMPANMDMGFMAQNVGSSQMPAQFAAMQQMGVPDQQNFAHSIPQMSQQSFGMQSQQQMAMPQMNVQQSVGMPQFGFPGVPQMGGSVSQKKYKLKYAKDKKDFI